VRQRSVLRPVSPWWLLLIVPAVVAVTLVAGYLLLTVWAFLTWPRH
jgi:hypothetical protein